MDSTIFEKQLTWHIKGNNIPFMRDESHAPIEYFPGETKIEHTSRIIYSIVSNRLGHEDLVIYLDREKNMVVIEVKGATPTLLNMLQSLGTFYGIFFKAFKYDRSKRAHLIFF